MKTSYTNTKTRFARRLALMLVCLSPILYLILAKSPPDSANLSQQGLPHESEFAAGELRKSGTIHLDIDCNPEVKEEFDTAVALLHSFFYDEARRRFSEIAKRDPQCAMAWWGIAMTWIHPLWAPPTLEERADGMAAISKAAELVGSSELEQGFIQSVQSYYAASEVPEFDANVIPQCSCCGPQAHSARATALHQKLRNLHRRFPDHVEVATFYLLAKLGTVDPKDKKFVVQRDVGKQLESLFEEYPDHPGIAHYLIHAYDYPELASGALVAARRYDDIAPWVPHALHMPTHIYTRLGMWEDSIEGNIASSAAARDYTKRYYDSGASMDDLHAMDYLMFAYMQTGRDREAEKLLQYLTEIKQVVPGNEFASAYAITAMPARYFLERGEWVKAKDLKTSRFKLVEQFPFAMAHTFFARAVGAARSGNVAQAEIAVEKLGQLRDSVKESKFQWWARQIEIQRLAAQGWVAHSKGQTKEATSYFCEAAEIEDKAGTHPVTPGQILPVREQFGEMLMETGKTKEALEQFERSLISFPRRFRSHYGAARAAAKLGIAKKSQEHADALIDMAGDGQRAEILQHARTILWNDVEIVDQTPRSPSERVTP